MIKGKFGDALRSKTDTAQVNEALCKVLAHNLCVLIASIFELGIQSTFWTEAATAWVASGNEVVVRINHHDMCRAIHIMRTARGCNTPWLSLAITQQGAITP